MINDFDSYVRNLISHNWDYKQSDCHSIWKSGSDMQNDLIHYQRSFDKNCEIWNQHCPADMKRKILKIGAAS